MSIGLWEILGLLIIIMIIFGAGKLPNVMSDLGKGVKSFKKGLNSEEETPEEPKKPESVKTTGFDKDDE